LAISTVGAAARVWSRENEGTRAGWFRFTESFVDVGSARSFLFGVKACRLSPGVCACGREGIALVALAVFRRARLEGNFIVVRAEASTCVTVVQHTFPPKQGIVPKTTLLKLQLTAQIL